MSVGLKINTDKVTARLNRMIRGLATPAEAALRLEGERIMTASKRIVPVDLGTLKSSGHVSSETTNGVTTVSLTYGGPAETYALIQHEGMHFNHLGQGEPKYLERPLNEAIPGMAERIAKTLKLPD